jgi:dihydropteroate synthase
MPCFQAVPVQSINAGGRLLSFELPVVMGILNVTPDSFFDGGKRHTIDETFRHAEKLLLEGADMIDIGAFSSRPGAKMISAQEEIDGAMPIVERITKNFPDIILSIDTFRADVARACVEGGVHIVNDISGGAIDEDMFATVADLQVPYILMHMRGTPQTMQQLTDYEDIATDIAVYFGDKIAELRALGVKDIVLDPGFGFSKTVAQNYELLMRLDELQYFDLPILGGISRKSLIYKKLNVTPEEALNGTTALNTLLLERGAHILRVHDVKEAKQLIQLLYQ